MSLKRKVKRFIRRTIGDFTGLQWRDLDHKKVYLVLAALVAVLILVIVLIVGAISGGKKEEPQEMIPNQDVTEDVSVESTETVEEENPLEVDAYAGINEIVLKYFNGLSSGNTDMVEETVDVLTDEEKMTIQKKKDYIEAYNNVVCYTKKGLEDNSYVVFASYEMKIYNIETAAPGIMALYVCTGADGNLYIFNGEASEELENYVLELAAEEDVATVIAEVDARYQQLLEEDEDLGNFAQTMLESQEIAEEEPGSEETETENPETEETEQGESSKEIPGAEGESATAVNKTMELTDAIRIRKEASTDSEIVARGYTNELVKVFESYDNGWSKIEYNGTTGYCKTEFLREAD